MAKLNAHLAPSLAHLSQLLLPVRFEQRSFCEWQRSQAERRVGDVGSGMMMMMMRVMLSLGNGDGEKVDRGNSGGTCGRRKGSLQLRCGTSPYFKCLLPLQIST